MMILMKPVNVHEAKTHLSRLLARVEKGQEVVIAKAGKPVAKLVPIEPPRKPRVAGSAKGQIWIANDFDAPLPDDVLNLFNDGEVFPPTTEPARKTPIDQ
jgi:prevent-host-death family protein